MAFNYLSRATNAKGFTVYSSVLEEFLEKLTAQKNQMVSLQERESFI